MQDDDSEVIASRGIVGAPEANNMTPIPLKNVAMKIIEKQREEEAKAKAEEEEERQKRIAEYEEKRRQNDPEYQRQMEQKE